jgi:hypothetical protein
VGGRGDGNRSGKLAVSPKSRSLVSAALKAACERTLEFHLILLFLSSTVKLRLKLAMHVLQNFFPALFL